MKKQGFTLVELAVALVLAGLFAGLYMQVNVTEKPTDCVVATKNQLETIRGAIYRYVDGNDRFPMPALRTLAADNAAFGAENLTVANHKTFGPNQIAFGALPFKTLGLPPSFASDCWGNKFTYAVTVGLTNATEFKKVPPDTVVDGTIDIATANTGGTIMPSKAAFAVISHGANGIGAVSTNYTGADDRFIANVGTTLESGNFDYGDARIIAAPYNDGANAGNNFFDDLLVYGGKSLRRVDGKVAKEPNPPHNDILDTCETGIFEAVLPVVTCGGDRTWKCLGSNGGSTDTGTLTMPPCATGACGTAHNSTTYRLPAPPSTAAELCAAGTATAVTHDANTPPQQFSWSCDTQPCSATISYELASCADGGGVSSKADAQLRLRNAVQAQIGVPYQQSGDPDLIAAMDWAMNTCLMRPGNIGSELSRTFGTYTARCDFEFVGGPSSNWNIGLEVCPGGGPACTSWSIGCEPVVMGIGNACEAGGGTIEFVNLGIDNMLCGGEVKVNWRCCGAGTSTPVNGQCGSANGSTIAAALPANDPTLCNQGSAFAINTTATEQRWRCSGTNGGADSPPCMATISNACTTIGDYNYDNSNQCWIFTESAQGQFCKGEKTPECWTPPPGACGPTNVAMFNECGTVPNHIAGHPGWYREGATAVCRNPQNEIYNWECQAGSWVRAL